MRPAPGSVSQEAEKHEQVAAFDQAASQLAEGTYDQILPIQDRLTSRSKPKTSDPGGEWGGFWVWTHREGAGGELGEVVGGRNRDSGRRSACGCAVGSSRAGSWGR